MPSILGHTNRPWGVIFLAAFYLVVVACGGDEGPAASTATPAPTAVPAPPPTPTPSTEVKLAPKVDRQECPRKVTVGQEYDCKIQVRNVNSVAWFLPLELYFFVPKGVSLIDTVLKHGDRTFEPKIEEGEDSNKTFTWPVGNVPPGDEVEASLRLKSDLVEPNIKVDQLYTFSTRSIIETLAQGSGMTVSVNDSLDPVKVGEEVDYLVTLQNQGATILPSIEVEVQLPENIDFLNATGGSYDVGTRTVRFDPVSLTENDDRKVLKLTAVARVSGAVVVTTLYRRDGFDPGTPEQKLRIEEGTRILN